MFGVGDGAAECRHTITSWLRRQRRGPAIKTRFVTISQSTKLRWPLHCYFPAMSCSKWPQPVHQIKVLNEWRVYSWETSIRGGEHLHECKYRIWDSRILASTCWTLYRGPHTAFQGPTGILTMDSVIFHWILLVQLLYYAIVVSLMAQTYYIYSIYHVFEVYIPVHMDFTHEYHWKYLRVSSSRILVSTRTRECTLFLFLASNAAKNLQSSSKPTKDSHK
jgi:hypothetical protein